MDDLFGSDSDDDHGGGTPAATPTPPITDGSASSSIAGEGGGGSSSSSSSSSSSYSNDNNKDLFEISSNIRAIGGGRGIFAVKNIPAGSLILAEIPQMVWQNFDLSDADILRSIIQEILIGEKNHSLTKFLHPTSIHDADSVEISNALDMYGDGDFDAIVENFGDKVQKDEILRIFLVLQHNAFASGLYKYLSLFNHSCVPNCIKFSPKPSNNGASEIWSIRPIKAGEELTICYAESQETTIKSMQEYLMLNHRFECVCERCSSLAVAKINTASDASLPSFELDSLKTIETRTSKEVAGQKLAVVVEVKEEKNVLECEHLVYEEAWKDELTAMESEVKWQSIEENKSNFRTCRDIISACQIRLDTVGSIPKIDVERCEKYCMCCILQNRTYKVLVNASAQCVAALQEIKSNSKEAVKYASKLATIDDFDYMADFFVYNLRLVRGVIERSSVDHPDLAGIFLDIANGLEGLARAYPARIAEIDLSGVLDSTSIDLIMKGSNKINSKKCAQDLIAHYKNEGKRLRQLYNTRLRYPEVYKHVRASGDFFWSGLKL